MAGLFRLSHSLACGSNRSLEREYDMGIAQCKILWMLKSHPEGVPQKTIAEWLFQTEATVSRQMQMLMNKGLLESTVPPSDRRQHLVRLTPKGQEFAAEAMQCVEQTHSKVFAVLSRQEQAEFDRILTKLFEAADQEKANKGESSAHKER